MTFKRLTVGNAGCDNQRMRTDIHRPGVFEPQNYELGECFDTRPDMPDPRYFTVPGAFEAYMKWRNAYMDSIRATFGGRIPHTCDHCGHGGLRYVWAVEHTPTGDVIAMGDDCVRGGRLRYPDNAAFRLQYIKDKAARDHAHFQNLAKLGKWTEANPEAAAFLAELPESESFTFLVDLKRKLASYYELSERQTAAILKIRASRIERDAANAARKAQEAAEATMLAPTGTATVTGVLLKVNTYKSEWGTQYKMLVRLDDGNKVFGTVPGSLFGPVYRIDRDGTRHESLTSVLNRSGERVTFTANFERKEDHFAYFARPRKAAFLEVVA